MTGALKFWDGAAWQTVGVGPPGPTGADGATGPTGPTGPQGPPGSTEYTTRMSRTSGVSVALPAGTWTKVPLDSVIFDTAGNADVTHTRMTIQTAGKYRVTAGAYITMPAGGAAAGVSAYVNGNQVGCYAQQYSVNTTVGPTASDTFDLKVGDYVELMAYCSVTGGAYQYNWNVNYLVVEKIGAGAQGPPGATGATGPAGASGTQEYATRMINQNVTAQSLTSATWTKVPTDGVTFDTASNADVANKRITITTAGKYKVTGVVSITTPTTAFIFDVAVAVKGVSPPLSWESVQQPASSTRAVLNASDTLDLKIGDYLELYVRLSASGGSYGGGTAGASFLVAERVGAGPTGATGTSWKQYTGTGTPTPVQVAGNNGDYTVRTSDGEVFQMISGAWVDQGWSLQGSQLNTLYAARAYRSAALTLATQAYTKIAIDTRSFDPGNNVSLANSRYVCPVAGYYSVESQVHVQPGTGSAAMTPLLSVFKNGSEVSRGTWAYTPNNSFVVGLGVADTIQCNAGDYLELQVYNPSTIAAALYDYGATCNYLSVSLISATAVQTQPLQPASQARAYRSAAMTLTANSFSVINTDTAVYDAGNNLPTSKNYYVCPVAGYYQVDAAITATATAAGQSLQVNISNGGSATNQAAAAGPLTTTISDVIKCNAGDFIQMFYNCSAALAVVTGLINTYFSVTLVGTIPTTAPSHAARAWRNAALTTSTNAWAKVPIDTVAYDLGGNLQIANGRYICPVAGIYDVIGNVLCGESATGTYTNFATAIYKNGVMVSMANNQPAVSNIQGTVVADKIQCVAGDYLELWVFNAQSGTGLSIQGAIVNYLSVSLLTGTQPGPQGPTGPAGNSIDAKTAARAYLTGSNQTLPASVNTKILFNAKSFDSGNNFNTFNGRYVCPVAGFYQISATINRTAAGEITAVLYRNGTLVSWGSDAQTTGIASTIADVIQCSANDYLELWAFSPTATAILADPTASATYVSIVKVDTGGPPGPPGGPANQVAFPYAVTPGYTPDRSFSPALTSLGEIAAVLATLIDDMKSSGLIKP